MQDFTTKFMAFCLMAKYLWFNNLMLLKYYFLKGFLKYLLVNYLLYLLASEYFNVQYLYYDFTKLYSNFDYYRFIFYFIKTKKCYQFRINISGIKLIEKSMKLLVIYFK